MTQKNQKKEQPCLRNSGCSHSLPQKEVTAKRNISSYWTLRSLSYGSDVSPEELSAWSIFLTSISKDMRNGGGRLKVLDVGTGRGFLALILAGMGHQVTGLDLSFGMLGFAKAECHEKGAPEFCLGDAERLPFREESFDLVISRHLLWTLPHPGIAIREWKRVLRPDGRIAAIDGLWFDDSPGMRLRRLLSSAITAIKERRDTRTFERHYQSIKKDLPLYSPDDPDDYMTLFQEAELKRVSFQYLKEVDRAQRRRVGLDYRLANEKPVFLVMGQKG